jgi:hypothetical protein
MADPKPTRLPGLDACWKLRPPPFWFISWGSSSSAGLTWEAPALQDRGLCQQQYHIIAQNSEEAV